jgi:biofilm PGA synthesis N-glycosyltransferase PgaC
VSSTHAWQSTSGRLTYALVTPARNEEEHIRRTLESMVRQTARPLRWVVVSDGSTDATDEIVASYQDAHPWIRLVHLPEERDRTFAAKVHSFNAGLRELDDVPYDVIGNLDADISFGNDYFAYLLNRFEHDPRLGVAGTPFVEDGQHYDYRFTNIAHVSGACQLFRRRCFADIGGYMPVAGGGIDWIAVTTARMMGWSTRTFTGRTCLHHRPMGTGAANRLTALFRQGRKDYYLGGHPVWQVFRCGYQLSRPPLVVGSVCLFVGYAWAALTRVQRPVSVELMAFHRGEQIGRLKSRLLHSLRWTH